MSKHEIGKDNKSKQRNQETGSSMEIEEIQKDLALRNIELTGENAKILESSGEDLRIHWRSQGLKKLGQGCGFIGFFIGLALIGILVASWIKSTILAVTFLITCLWFLGKSLLIVYEALHTLFSKLPVARDSAEGSLTNHYEVLMTCVAQQGGKVATVPFVEAYVCLLEQAKHEFSDYDEYVSYWPKKGKEVWEQLKEYFGSHLSEVKFSIQSIETIDSKDNIYAYRTTIRVEGFKGMLGSSFDPLKSIGFVHLVENKVLVKIKERFYLTNALWTGKLV